MPELTNRRVEARTMADLAAVHARHGALREAIACYERSLEALRELGDRAGEARMLRELEALRPLAATAQGTSARSNARTAS